MSARRLQRFAALALCTCFVSELHAQSDSKLRFVVLGHLRGDKNGELLANLPEVVASVRAEDPDLVFLCGDLIWGDVDRDTPADPAVIRADWERLDNALVGVGAPIYRVPGNHDICDVATRDVWLERYGSLPRAINFGNARFLLLSSAWWPGDGETRKHPQEMIRGTPLSETQIGFLSSELQSAPGIAHAFVFMHHMLWWEDDAGWWKKVAPVLEGHAVRAVFAGDYGPMKFAHLERGGIHYLQTSIENRVSLEMLRGREASRMLSSQFDNYIVVDIDGANVSYSVRAVGALSTDKFSPAHFREVHEYDKDSYARKLLRRWSTPERLIAGLLQISLAAFAAGAAFVLGFVLLRKLRAGRHS